MTKNAFFRGAQLLAVAVLAAVACTDNPITSLEPSGIQLKPGGGKGGGKGGGGKTGSVSATVVVEQFTGARVTQDGLGSYIDGQDRVSATVERQFGFNTDKDKAHKKPTIRSLCLDFGDPVDQNVANPPFEFGCISDAGSSTRDHDNDDQDPPGVIGMTENSMMKAGFRIYFLLDDATIQYWLRFCDAATKADPTKCADGGRANLVTVRRGTGNNWTVEAGTTQIARLHGQPTSSQPGPPVFLGDYLMPFKYTITGN